MNSAQVLTAFDRHVRQSTAPDGTGASFESDALVTRRLAPPRLGWSTVLWSDLDASTADSAIAAQVALFSARGEAFEWKLYSYDEPADLAARLRAAGFRQQEPESLMVAEIAGVMAALGSAGLPAGVRLERVTDDAGVDMLVSLHELVFHRDEPELRESLSAQLATAPATVGLVLAMAGDRPVCGARVEHVAGTEFAGLWGGGTLPAWRGLGIYRALVRFRAELAASMGCEYLTVDASDQSRPILERVGFTCLATTTPYLWSPA